MLVFNSALLILMKQIDISKILNLTDKNKFEITCAAFDAVDHVLKLDIPKSLKGRKSAVQAISLLADNQLKYGYDKTTMLNSENTKDHIDASDSEKVSDASESTESEKELPEKSAITNI